MMQPINQSIVGSTVAAAGVAVPGDSSGSYPGGKSGSGIYQRLINLIPPHRVWISAFAGRCGVTRRIRPAEHTIVIEADANVCEWWDTWRRSPEGRALEIHHCDSIEWIRHRFGLTEYSAAGSCVAGSSDQDRAANIDGGGRIGQSRTITRPVMTAAVSRSNATAAADAQSSGDGHTFVFCDPPYVLSERAHGKQYTCELSDDQHAALVRILTTIPAARAGVLLCGYRSPIYAAVDRDWRSIDHRVPTRGGLQNETIWMNYPRPARLHDHRYVGDCRRHRERIRRRQVNWVSQLEAMGDRERAAMLEALSDATDESIG